MTKSEGGPVSAGPPDLLYVIGPGTSGHEELRHSLRSVAKNLRHGKVWIVGSVPDWVTGITPIPLTPEQDKYRNIRQSVTAAVNDPRLSESFVLMNDDHFVIESCQKYTENGTLLTLPVWHLGRSSEHLEWLRSIGKRGEWMEACTASAEWYGDPLFYENHIPLLFSKQALSADLRAYPNDRPWCPGLAYQSARAGSEGVLGPCVKVTNQPLESKLGTPFLSSVDWSFAKGDVGRYVRSLFPEKCRYEA